jgi:hypothetical protein
MTAAKRKQREEAGWTVGSTANFLRLSQEEQAIIEMRLALQTGLRSSTSPTILHNVADSISALAQSLRRDT